MSLPDDVRRTSPAALRNREPILAVLRTMLPLSGTILEIASGSGEHIVHFAQALPNLVWQPSDPSDAARASIAAWIGLGDAPRSVLPPLALDAGQAEWPIDRADAILAINMVHISPWCATLGLLRGAGRVLPPDAPLFLYGPYRQSDRPLAPSNAAFDADLRARNSAWGLRALDDVAVSARESGLALERIVDMPANNLAVIFRRA